MTKSDNFDAGKWLVENKMTTQSKLNEEVSDNVKQFLNNEFEIYLEGGDSFEEEPGETHVFTMEEDEEPYKDNYLFNSAINQLQNNPIVLDYNKDYIGDYGKVTASANAKNIFISFIVPDELGESKVNKEEGTDILSFLKSNKQELLSKLATKFKYDEDDMEMMSEYEIEIGADADGNEDVEIAGLGEAGLDFSFNSKKVKDTYGDASNFKLVIAGKPIYGISYNM
jgi:hypothetical protein